MRKLVTFHAPIGIFLVICAAMSIILLINVEAGKAADPANDGVRAALAAAAHGGPLPGLYAPLSIDLVAVKHGVERTSAADIHAVAASFMFHGDPNVASIWLIADRSYTRSDCAVDMSGLRSPGDGGSVVAACFVLPPGEKPAAAFVASGGRSGVFEIDREMFEVMPLPLFGAPEPPGLACSTTASGTVCAPPGA